MPIDIASHIVTQNKVHYTPSRSVLCGEFNISKVSIPYFQGVMSLEEATKELKLVENLPSDLRSMWRLEELFQREIDWERVEQQIVNGYLRRSDKLQFFNSLTVALLPLDDRQHLASSYVDPENPPPMESELAPENWDLTNVGRVQVIKLRGTNHASLRWDPKRVFPAAIDGQHRLAALKRYVERGNLSSKELATTISVIYLILDNRVGFQMQENAATNENPILTAIREIFIDLNKSAKAVSRTRQILLDDQTIESRCVRALLAGRIGDKEDGVLPLGLVHWQGEVGAKFNIGERTAPFITTVELLNSIIGIILDLQPPKDPLNDGQVVKFVESLENTFNLSQVIADNPLRYPQHQHPLIEYVQKHYFRDEKPLANLPGHYLQVVSDIFRGDWRLVIVSTLMRFAPYAKFIAEVDQRGGLEGELAFYLALPPRAQLTQREDWGDTVSNRIEKPLRELAGLKLESWAFYAVFQKGLLSASIMAWKQYSIFNKVPTAENFVEDWIAFLNFLDARGLFAVKSKFDDGKTLWEGISVNKSNQTISWSDASMNKIRSLLNLWWYVYRGGTSVKALLTALDDKRSAEKWPEGKTDAERLKKALKKIAPDNIEEEKLEAFAHKRLSQILKLALPPKEASQA